MRILVVEDDLELAAQLCAALEAAGFAVDQEHDGEAASMAGTVEVYSAAVLDLGLPRKDGLSVLRDWREAGCTWPVLVLTARNRWSDKVAGFNAGADDYLTKPFLMDEVVLRLRAMLRRTAGAASAVLRVGQLEYDVVHGRFNLQGQGLQLTAQEHKILAFFMHHPGKLLTRSEISENVYARDLDPDSNTLDVLIGRIRRTLGGAAQLVTERGQGFRLLTSDEASSDAAVPAADVQWQVQAMAQVIDRYQARTFSDALHMQAAMHPATAAQPVDIAQCVGEVVRMMERLHADQALEWTLQVQDGTTPLWRGERTDLEEALGNLLDNAGKWAASAVRIGLAVEEGDAAQPPHVVLQIEDDGPGMAPHQLQAAGQRGLRFDDSVQGSGLGLHIATQMVQAYGGELSLGKSALLKGLSVRVVLPGVQAAQRPRKA